jgi:murein tripeptide amidase MpaA
MVPPALKDIFSRAGIEQSIFIEDVQDIIDEGHHDNLKASASDDFFSAYRKTADVMTWISGLKTQFPDLITTSEIGKTVQGQSIVAVHLQSKKGPAAKPRIVYNSCQHAREWITVTTVNYILNWLVTGYGKNDTVTGFVDGIDWTFIPIVNVDGYDYTWNGNRLWRKNRKSNKGSCAGVDNNRNWPYKWNTGGSSSDPCADDYHGPSAGSEPENVALANYVKNTPRVAGYIDFHSYSQLWMCPWGYTTSLPPHYSKIYPVMTQIANAIRATNGKHYAYGNIASTIYVASGSSADYTYSLGIDYSFAVELRDTGSYGFVLPTNQIKPQAEEIVAAVLVMGNTILK